MEIADEPGNVEFWIAPTGTRASVNPPRHSQRMKRLRFLTRKPTEAGPSTSPAKTSDQTPELLGQFQLLDASGLIAGSPAHHAHTRFTHVVFQGRFSSQCFRAVVRPGTAARDSECQLSFTRNEGNSEFCFEGWFMDRDRDPMCNPLVA